MKQWASISLIALVILTGCTESTTEEGDNDDNNEYTFLSSNNSSDSYITVSKHYQGESCLNCHGFNSINASLLRDDDNDDDNDDSYDNDYESEGEDENDEKFTSGGTVFTKLNASNDDVFSYASGYTLRLVLENTNQTITYEKERGTGNAMTEASIGTINAYTAQVLNSQGNVVNTSIANSHDVTRLDCNSCHTAEGNSGAPGRMTSYFLTSGSSSSSSSSSSVSTQSSSSIASTTNNAPLFSSDVMPDLENRCQSCHGGSGNLRIGSTSETYLNLTTATPDSSGFSSFLDIQNPTNSLLLTKAIGMSHGGGSIISGTSSEYVTLRDWIADGAQNN